MKKTIAIIIAILGVSLFAGPSPIQGQQPSQTPTRPVQPRTAHPAVPANPSTPAIPATPAVPATPVVDPLGDVMFPPDLIMRHARELALTDVQRTFIRDEIQKTTARFNELQWQLHEAMDQFHQTLESTSVDDARALAQLDKVLDVEREIKRLHIGMGIRLKNQLTPEQQAKLQAIRTTPRPAHRG